MLDFEYLYKGKWMSVVRPVDIPDYEVIHEEDGVMVMPLIVTPSDMYTVIRKEFCPPYIMKSPEYTHYYTIISGGKDSPDEEPLACMLRELKEETGIEPKDYEILWVLENRPEFKGSDRRAARYIIKINSFNLHRPEPDGTMGEALSRSIPIRVGDLKTIIEKPNCDFLLYSMVHILFDVISNKIHGKTA